MKKFVHAHQQQRCWWCRFHRIRHLSFLAVPNFSRKDRLWTHLVHSCSVRCQHNFDIESDWFSTKFVFGMQTSFFTFKNSKVRKLFWSYQAVNLVIVEYSFFVRRTFYQLCELCAMLCQRVDTISTDVEIQDVCVITKDI